MNTTYQHRRSEIETYFDRTAADTWARLTSDAPVSRIRATVRAGRDRMRDTLLSWLPPSMAGQRLLDAGCGTGALSVCAALRGAHVVAIDLSPTLVQLARERQPLEAIEAAGGRIDFLSGDMLDPGLGRFDYVVGMDSLIHYQVSDAVVVLSALASRTRCAVLFSHAPSSPALQLMHAAGKLFPRGNRSPSIVPVHARTLAQQMSRDPVLQHWHADRTERISSGFYTSQALEMVPA